MAYPLQWASLSQAALQMSSETVAKLEWTMHPSCCWLDETQQAPWSDALVYSLLAGSTQKTIRLSMH